MGRTKTDTSKNLITITSPTRARELGRQGGLIRSDAKKKAAQLRELKKRIKNGNITCKDEEWLLARIEDPSASSMNIISLLDEVKADETDLSSDTKIRLAQAYSQAHKLIHGERVRNENLNLNVNITADVETAYKEMKRMRDENEKQ